MRKLFGIALLVLAAAVPAAAQDYRPIGVNFGGGWVFPISGCTGGNEDKCFSDVFDAGWNGSVGVTFNVSPTVGVQAEYMYGRMGGPDRTIDISPGEGLPPNSTGVIESNHQMHTVTFNAIFNTPLNTGQPVGAITQPSPTARQAARTAAMPSTTVPSAVTPCRRACTRSRDSP